MASYQVQISERAAKEIRRLPGNFRQRVIRALHNLEQTSQPADSIRLALTNSALDLAVDMELYRIRLEEWRILYVYFALVRTALFPAGQKRSSNPTAV